ncbi:MAG: glycine-rich domain-containing protein [Candidatus Avispirillum sp.]
MVSIGGGAFIVPSFTGSYAVFGDEKKGYIELYSSGTLTFSKNAVVDVFLLGGGARGAAGTLTMTTAKGGSGGKGSSGNSYYEVPVSGDYTIEIGSSEGTSTAFGYSQASGGGSAGGVGAVVTPDNVTTKATSGSTGVSYPFGGDNTEFLINYGAGGGGGGARSAPMWTPLGSGGTLGGGAGGNNSLTDYNGGSGTANTGSGGGGGGAVYYSSSSTKKGTGGAGGSGLVIVRWGY